MSAASSVFEPVAFSPAHLDFEVTITGFSMPEIDVLIGGLEARAQKPDPADAVPEATGPAVTRIGDVWQIGPHRLICGDATAPETYARLLEGVTAQMVFTDPPFNVPIAGHVSGLGKINHREFACASGEMSSAEYTAFLRSVFGNLTAVASDGAIHFVAMDWRHMREVMDAADGVYSALKNLCVWSKTNGGMGSLYRSQHELFFVFNSGTAAHKQRRAWQEWALPDECLDLCRYQRVAVGSEMLTQRWFAGRS